MHSDLFSFTHVMHASFFSFFGLFYHYILDFKLSPWNEY